jgi:cyclopropane-fatty-acyl-phospholipid synthase
MHDVVHDAAMSGVPPEVRATSAGLTRQPTGCDARLFQQVLKNTTIPCEFCFASGETLRLGQGPPAFTFTFHSDRMLRRGLSEYSLARAYVDGEMDIEGHMPSIFEIRRFMKGEVSSLFMLRMWLHVLLDNPIRLNRSSIAKHYSFGDDFYLSFVDQRYHLYSHCLFHGEAESLEQAAEHKLATMARALRLEPGMRLLDIGAGWGAVTRYCGPRNIHVTALTIAEDSHKLHRDLIEAERLEHCECLLEDFLVHQPAQAYDAIVIFGVIEHIPDYRRFADQVWKCLKPGGRIYLDASAVLEKYQVSDFVRTYIYPGTHTYLCLPDLIQELLMHGFKVQEVVDETHDYHLTLTHWAQRFDSSRDTITARWGEKLFRAFRLYLWGGAHAMGTRNLQAYHVVAERTRDRGIRPGLWRRLRCFVRSLT